MGKNYNRWDFSQDPRKFEEISSKNGFVGADLRGAKFDGLSINKTNFSSSLLHGASFRKTILCEATFDKCKTGLTTVRRVILIVESLLLSFVAGLNAVYAIDFLNLITERGDSPITWIVFVTLFVGITSCIFVVVYFDGGVVFFFRYILALVVLSSTLTALTESAELAAYSSLSKAYIVVSLVSIWMTAQASFILTEFGRISGNIISTNKLSHCIPLILFSAIGAGWGTCLADKSEFSTLSFLGGFILCLTGFFLGEETSKKYSSERFSLLRQFFAKVIQSSTTSFKDAEFENLSFRDSYIANCDLSPKKIRDDLELLGSDLDDIDKDNLYGRSHVFTNDRAGDFNKTADSQPNLTIIHNQGILSVSQKQVNNAEHSRYTDFTVEGNINESGVAIGDSNDLKNSSSN